ncbi:hypothetical protein AOL_s00088g36 [Orbilia oligospora ATCC 24927]|uniref:Uncharacterized protein n=1 Tax=Arthrobotrys oligospora (strain ATCC 24927 / CBS 115.81 / DSM 1491) TaxID=756982 RepID=G1XHS3_ARTOA|nr:hypothetical protein AOL_s00088g36 [Orbilia oligospora ATCC 24927]EGX47321.1 hypothetical protein AOL_s00088g36 [Orbilia oligospora ATCC 24927]
MTDDQTYEQEETAAKILSTIRHRAPSYVSPTACLAPSTYEEELYAYYPKIDKQISIPELQEKLGISTDPDDRKKAKWKNLRDLVERLSLKFDFEDKGVTNRAKITQAIAESPAWNDCNPISLTAAFTEVLIYKYQRNERRKNTPRE